MRKEHLISLDATSVVDLNANGIDDGLEPPDVDCTASAVELKHRLERNTSTDPHLSAGDIDAQWDMAESTGDEAAGGSCATPDQSVVDDIGEALGVTYREGEELNLVEKERERDAHRWELDPASSDDFLERMKSLGPNHKKTKNKLFHS